MGSAFCKCVGRARCPRFTGTVHKAINLRPSSSRPIRVCLSLWLVLMCIISLYKKYICTQRKLLREQIWCAQSLSVSGPMDCIPPDSSVHGILQARRRVGCHFLLQGTFPTQGLNPHLLSPALAARFLTTTMITDLTGSHHKKKKSVTVRQLDTLWCHFLVHTYIESLHGMPALCYISIMWRERDTHIYVN